jgi:hypothetical protein
MSRDGAHLAYAALDDEGWRVVHDGKLGPIVDAVMSNTLTISPDGARLAWVGLKRGLSHAFVDGAVYGAFSLIGRPIFSSDSRRFAFVGARGDSLRAVVDGGQQAQFDEIVELAFSTDGARVGYFGLRGDRWHAVIDGAVGPPFDLTASLMLGERTAYLAREGSQWHLVLDGRSARRTTRSHLARSASPVERRATSRAMDRHGARAGLHSTRSKRSSATAIAGRTWGRAAAARW